MEMLLAAGIIALLLKIAYLDYKYYYIADTDIGLGILLSLLFRYLQNTLPDGLLGLVVGFTSAGLVYIYGRFKYKNTALGSGDVTLCMFLGSVIGAEAYGSWAVCFACVFLAGVFPLYLSKKISWSRAFPLAPFLNGVTLVWFICRTYVR